MSIVFSDEIPQSSQMREWWYNSLDAAVTHEISGVLESIPHSHETYRFELALQGPALDMMLRGFRIDPVHRARSIHQLAKAEEAVQIQLDKLAFAIWGSSLNPRSPDQLKEFLYDRLALPEQWVSKKGVRSISTNREALEKLDDYYLARPIVALVFMARELRKKLGVLRTGVDPDGRMRCTYNVCGTDTGRWASSSNVFGRGSNLQNITEELRRMFVADPGYVLVYLDGEQAESRSVGFILGTKHDDWRYLDACEAGDLHTHVTKLVWPGLPWTGDPQADREIADAVFYRHLTHRDMSKKGGHGSNYYGQPWTISKHMKVPQAFVENFQKIYVPAFGLDTWWRGVQSALMHDQSITTFLGRERTFFGRPNDDATLRQAIAHEPQSTVGDIVNEGGYRVWKKYPQAQALAQIHDAYLFQIPENEAETLIPQMKATFEVPVYLRGRTLLIPGEAQVGWNWSKMDPKKKTFIDGNPDGLCKWSGKLERRRTENPEASLLDRVIR